MFGPDDAYFDNKSYVDRSATVRFTTQKAGTDANMAASLLKYNQASVAKRPDGLDDMDFDDPMAAARGAGRASLAHIEAPAATGAKGKAKSKAKPKPKARPSGKSLESILSASVEKGKQKLKTLRKTVKEAISKDLLSL